MKNIRLDFNDLQLTPEDVIREMGYGSPPDAWMTDLIGSLFEKIASVTRPLCTFRLFNGKIQSGGVVLNGNRLLQTGEVIGSLLEGSSQFALFVATSGNEFQTFYNQLKNEGDILKTYIVDTIGSCIAEKTGDYLESILETEIGKMRHTNRFSPGYCGWALAGQQEIFSLLGGNPCGISLSDVFLMYPIKSISGIIGIGENVNEDIYGCAYCELETCYKRKS